MSRSICGDTHTQAITLAGGDPGRKRASRGDRSRGPQNGMHHADSHSSGVKTRFRSGSASAVAWNVAAVRLRRLQVATDSSFTKFEFWVLLSPTYGP